MESKVRGARAFVLATLVLLVISAMPGDSPRKSRVVGASSKVAFRGLPAGLADLGGVVQAQDDYPQTAENILVAVDVLANDQVVGGLQVDPLHVRAVTQPSDGNATINPDDTVTYSPNKDFYGNDSFQYTAVDQTGLLTGTATVYVTIDAVSTTTSTTTTLTTPTTTTTETSTLTTPTATTETTTLTSPTTTTTTETTTQTATLTTSTATTVTSSSSTTTTSSSTTTETSTTSTLTSSSSSTTSTSTTSTVTSSTTTSSTTAGQSSPPGKRFIRIRALNPHSAWGLPGYDAQQVLAMISQMRPDALERYTDGPQNPNAAVPVASGSPPMTVGEFLNQSMRACSCYIIPGLSLNLYDQGRLFTAAQSLLGLPVYPKMMYLSLDSWHNFSKNHSPDQIQSMFQQLYSQGWAGIGVNANGGYFPTYGYATFTDFRISPSNWQPDSANLADARSESNINVVLLYIDFPKPMDSFAALSPDQEAQILTDNVASAQSSDGFYFVYPIVQSFWDSNNHTTSSGGHYQGETIYTVMLQLMQQYD